MDAAPQPPYDDFPAPADSTADFPPAPGNDADQMVLKGEWVEVAEEPPLEQPPAAQPTSPPIWPGWLTPSLYILVASLALGGEIWVAPSLSQGVQYAGLAALLLVIGPLAAIFLGMPQLRWRWLMLALIFIALGAGGILGTEKVALVQAQFAHDHGAYALAVKEYEQLGDAPPYSQRLAQTYLDWATAEERQRAFGAAIDHLTYVATRFPTTPQAAQAQAWLPQAHLAWAEDASAHNNPVRAGQEFNIVLTIYQNADAARLAHDRAAPAFLAWAGALHDAHNFEQADKIYQLIFTTYPASTQARSAAAQNLLDWANQLLAAGIFDQANQHFQDLVAKYGNTPAAAQAQTVLNHGVPVVGQLLRADGKTPAHALTTVRLSSRWQVNGDGTYQVFGQQFLADTDANGNFVFPSIPPGQYLLEWRGPTGQFLTYIAAGQPRLTIAVLAIDPPTLAPITTDQA